MEMRYSANIAKCLKVPVFRYKPSSGDVFLSCFSVVPVGVFTGLFFRWRMKRGWSYPMSDPKER